MYCKGSSGGSFEFCPHSEASIGLLRVRLFRGAFDARAAARRLGDDVVVRRSVFRPELAVSPFFDVSSVNAEMTSEEVPSAGLPRVDLLEGIAEGAGFLIWSVVSDG